MTSYFSIGKNGSQRYGQLHYEPFEVGIELIIINHTIVYR
jgi:hypothetical protein